MICGSLVGFFVADEIAPDGVEEAGHADDVAGVPRLLRFQRAHVHFVQAEGVGAVVPDDVVGVDDVAAALAHLEAAGFDGDGWIGFEDVAVAALFDVSVLDATGRRISRRCFWMPTMRGSSATASSSMSCSSVALIRSHRCREDVVFRLAQDQALVDQPLERLGRRDMAQIEQHLVPEPGIEQMQHGVLDAADVQVHRHPVFFFFGIDESSGRCADRCTAGNTSSFRPIAAWCWFRGRQVVPSSV